MIGSLIDSYKLIFLFNLTHEQIPRSLNCRDSSILRNTWHLQDMLKKNN